MGNPRNFTTMFNARNYELEAALKSAGVRGLKKRRELMGKAASGRPADLADQARASLSKRRAASQVQASLDMIAGRV